MRIDTRDDTWQTFDIRNSFVRFSGHDYHASTPFEGERFSIVWFTHRLWNRFKNNTAVTEHLLQMSFNLPQDLNESQFQLLGLLAPLPCTSPMPNPQDQTAMTAAAAASNDGDDASEPNNYEAELSRERLQELQSLQLEKAARDDEIQRLLGQPDSMAQVAALLHLQAMIEQRMNELIAKIPIHKSGKTMTMTEPSLAAPHRGLAGVQDRPLQ